MKKSSWRWLAPWLLPAATLFAEEPTTPDLDLLEFIGSWELDDGQWYNPVESREAPAEDSGSHSSEEEAQHEHQDH